MSLNEIRDALLELSVEELDELIAYAYEIKSRKEEGDPVLKALEEADYDFRDNCCEDGG